ncbi:MAG: hypothetical protein A3B38_01815 [Candidatus Levybacteria bacterium RIFCSPLOWO2_01_FULL_36_13]|nr:MAG: hypothetical protein A2684_03050 [Candidatus Levybacteria bacterium RIFCSPHIGHO2_01_FULL_36_15b]OGH35599.1 MAG: hypothetical protein A3B38_01815 [Candidatus Levybacteria bacterium RIFCSPLOWO2_01_FULL_36_13]
MLKQVKVVFIAIIILFIFYSLYLLAYLPLQGEIKLTNDIGRDFLLLQELDQKKIVLIGPRSNTQGVFHGPLWTYVNYPAYLIGQGNPVITAWFWVILGFIFLLSTFFILRRLFGTIESLLGVSLLSTYLVPHINSVFHAEVNFFLIPSFLYTIYSYLQTKKSKYLAFHIMILAAFIHLNIGVGILFIMLSGALILGLIIKNKLWKHLIAFIILPIGVSNFIAFDFRHNFGMAKALFNLGGNSAFLVPLNEWVNDRINNTVSMQILAKNIEPLSVLIFALIIIFTFIHIKNNTKQKPLLLLLLFYYFGYMALSYFNKGVILYHYIYLLVPLTIIWLVTLSKGISRFIFIPLIFVVLFLNFNFAKNYISDTQNNFIGKKLDSWISLKQVAKSVIEEQKGKEFGYFIYSPDAYAYQQRYAMLYSFKAARSNAFEYGKKGTTYVIASPPPPDNPYMGHQWWIENKANIKITPVEIKNFKSGYIVQKFNLNTNEQKIQHDPNIELGLNFR